ncbi:hypothetical protein F5984_02030 [Rudanella paleaurantiibacter]|uniref:ParE-like toxin domain-containing protein n=1 Tax=Rudanella paleaurantiibacter TaxID=2614655 RepID=A0A7J5U4I3_9BACT|nr:hypothetical protein [Rudanella paleaurantiibacter]KAB7732752.1 hypothetical protein F5984_02030 [Rudanella paleaurantiibacter]
MNHRATGKFWKCYFDLPEAIQELADKNFALVKADPEHPSLHFKEIKGRDGLWSARVGDHYRALGLLEGDDMYWFWIGHHSTYNNLIKRL